MTVDTSLSIDIKKATNSVERDENYVPLTRKDYGLPDEKHCQPLDYHEIFEETPIYTLGRMLAMQLLGWQFYLFRNTLGSPQYPPGANVIPSFQTRRKPTLILIVPSISCHPRPSSSPMRGTGLSLPILALRSWSLSWESLPAMLD